MKLIYYYPTWYLVVDYICGILMWVIVLRFICNIFFSIETNIKVIKTFFNFTDYILNFFTTIIPTIIPSPLQSAYLAWIIFMFRFYVLPITQGWKEIGFLSIPLEKDILLFLNGLL